MKRINVLLSTFFGYGYLTKIPGTVTSAVTVVFIYIAYEILGYTDLKFSIIFFILLFFYSFYAVKDSESEFKNKDPRQIVIDEVLGQSMPLILLLYLNQRIWHRTLLFLSIDFDHTHKTQLRFQIYPK